MGVIGNIFKHIAEMEDGLIKRFRCHAINIFIKNEKQKERIIENHIKRNPSLTRVFVEKSFMGKIDGRGREYAFEPKWRRSVYCPWIEKYGEDFPVLLNKDGKEFMCVPDSVCKKCEHNILSRRFKGQRACFKRQTAIGEITKEAVDKVASDLSTILNKE